MGPRALINTSHGTLVAKNVRLEYNSTTPRKARNGLGSFMHCSCMTSEKRPVSSAAVAGGPSGGWAAGQRGKGNRKFFKTRSSALRRSPGLQGGKPAESQVPTRRSWMEELQVTGRAR